jgi:hypothetical protein
MLKQTSGCVRDNGQPGDTACLTTAAVAWHGNHYYAPVLLPLTGESVTQESD